MRRLSLLLALALASGCGSAEDPSAAAAVTVVEDMLSRAPKGYTAYLAAEWQVPGADSMETIPADVLHQLRTVSRLPTAGTELIRSRNPEVIVLYLLRPYLVRSDSVLVAAGWMGLSGGDGGAAWGDEYTYVLNCRRGCQIVGEPGASTWN